MYDEEYKPDYGRRALFMAEDNKLRIMTLEKKVAVMERQLSERIDKTQAAVNGIAVLDTRIEIIHGDIVRAAESTVLKNTVPYINEKLSYTDYILISGSAERLTENQKTAPRMQVVPVTQIEDGFKTAGVHFVSKTAEIPAFSVLDGKTINSLGFCSGSGSIMFTQAVINGGIIKQAGKTLRIIATLCFVYA